jgi:hypothetical protein
MNHNWIVVERIDGKTHYTSGLDFGTARKLFCKITAAGGKAWMKNFIGGGECTTLS